MLTEQDKKAILNGAYAVTRNGNKVKYIGKSSLDALSLTFLMLPSESINYYKPFEDINIIFVDDDYFKASPPKENHHHDIVGLWIEPTSKVTLELPKPFKPKKNENFYTITSDSKYSYPEVVNIYNIGTQEDKLLVEGGLCFRTEQDAQAWLDAFKKALNE